MSRDVTIVVGPAAVCGPGAVDAESVDAAINCIDDAVGLLRAKIVDAQRIWTDVVRAAAGPSPGRLTAVYPSHWPPNRVDRVRAVVETVTGHAMFRDRCEVLREVAGLAHCPIIEVGEDLVVLSRPGRPTTVIRRTSAALPQVMLQRLGAAVQVIVDVPTGVVGAGDVAVDLCDYLGQKGIGVTVLGCVDLVRADSRDTGEKRWPARGAAATAVAAAAVTTLVVTAMHFGRGSIPGSAEAAVADVEPAWIVEGRVAVQVPARWTVDRVLSGAGSARVQIVSPDDGGRIIHLTQSLVPNRPSLAESAQALRAAADALPDGVIVEFNGAATAAGRDAVTYRELRNGHVVQWAVLVDDTVRIAIGCQGADIAAECDLAIRSAHRLR